VTGFSLTREGLITNHQRVNGGTGRCPQAIVRRLHPFVRGDAMPARPTVFHLDEDAPTRGRLEALLGSVNLPLASYRTAALFLAACAPEQPGCLVLEVRLPDQDGLDLLRDCSRRGICMPALILTGHGAVPLAVEAMKRGVVDFLEKSCSDHVLLSGIQQALALDALRRPERVRQQRTSANLSQLKPAEMDVLRLLLAGQGYKQTAADLGVSPKTVESRRAKIMQKMGCETPAELLARVLSYKYWYTSLTPWDREGLPRQPDCSWLDEVRPSL